MYVAESAQYAAYAELLHRHGVRITSGLGLGVDMMDSNPYPYPDPPEKHAYLGLTATLGPRVVISPHIAIFATEIVKCFPNPGQVRISSDSTLLLTHRGGSGSGQETCKWVHQECPVVIHELDLEGALEIEVDIHSAVLNHIAIGGDRGDSNTSINTNINTNTTNTVSIKNKGVIIVSTEEQNSPGSDSDSSRKCQPQYPLCCALSAEMIAMRGYICKPLEIQRLVVPNDQISDISASVSSTIGTATTNNKGNTGNSASGNGNGNGNGNSRYYHYNGVDVVSIGSA